MRKASIVYLLWWLIVATFTGCKQKSSPVVEVWQEEIPLEEVHRLGSLFDWGRPNLLYFSYSPQTAGGVVTYDVLSGETEIIVLPDLTNFPFVVVDKTGNIFGYSNENDLLSIYDIEKEKLILEVEGDPMVFSPDSTKMVIWRFEELYLIDLDSGSEQLIYQLDPKIRLEEKKYVSRMDWRPGTDQIAFILHFYDRPTENIVTDEVILLNLRTREAKLIDSAEMNFIGLAWSPDGRILGYSFGGYDLPTRLRLVDVENNCRIEDVRSTWPANAFWSPDGSQILHSYKNVSILDIQDYFGVGYQNLECKE